MSTVVQPAEPADAADVMQLISLCVREMHAHGIDQWDESYPNRQIVEQNICAQSLFLIRHEGVCAAAVCLDHLEPLEYAPLPWHAATSRPLFVHRLSVHPERRHLGLGRQLMDFAESLARQRHCDCVRFDCFSGNPRAQAFYEHLGFRRVGQVHFARRKPPYDCFEMLL